MENINEKVIILEEKIRALEAEIKTFRTDLKECSVYNEKTYASKEIVNILKMVVFGAIGAIISLYLKGGLQ